MFTDLSLSLKNLKVFRDWVVVSAIAMAFSAFLRISEVRFSDLSISSASIMSVAKRRPDGFEAAISRDFLFAGS